MAILPRHYQPQAIKDFLGRHPNFTFQILDKNNPKMVAVCRHLALSLQLNILKHQNHSILLNLTSVEEAKEVGHKLLLDRWDKVRHNFARLRVIVPKTYRASTKKKR